MPIAHGSRSLRQSERVILPESLATVATLWKAHIDAPFPPRLRGQEIAGVDVVRLDADIAGCVSSWEGNRGKLDSERWAILTRCRSDLERVLPALSEPQERAYYRRLYDMALIVLGN